MKILALEISLSHVFFTIFKISWSVEHKYFYLAFKMNIKNELICSQDTNSQGELRRRHCCLLFHSNSISYLIQIFKDRN